MKGFQGIIVGVLDTGCTRVYRVFKSIQGERECKGCTSRVYRVY